MIPAPESDDVAAPDPRPSVSQRIEAWNSDLSDADRRAKYCKMAASPFVFFRGTNHLFWEDNSRESRLAPLSSEATRTWLQGDLHAANFGAFDNDEGVVVYDLNDFDETFIADYQFDLWRMGVSMALLGRGNGNVTDAVLDQLLAGFVGSYVAAMLEYQVDDSENGVEFSEAAVPEPLRGFLQDVEARRDRPEELDEWTAIVDGTRRLDTALLELEAITAGETVALVDAMPGYGATLTGGLAFDPDYFAIKSAARRLLSGTGSLGTARYYLLIEGPSDDNDDDLILDVKRQTEPTAYVFAPAEARERYELAFSNHAVRHATGYKALANDVDDHLGVIALDGLEFSVRERSVFKKSFPIDELDGDDYGVLASTWGLVLATAHARADVDFDAALVPGSVDTAIAELTGGRGDELSATIRDLALEYAARVDLDWLEFVSELAPPDCD